MLVRLKEPMGYTSVGGHRVYGKCYAYGSFGATKIPRSVYFKHREILEEVEITGDWLSKKTGKKFPQLSFYLTKMYEVDLDSLINIAQLLGIEFIKTKEPNKNALSRAVVKRIEAL